MEINTTNTRSYCLEALKNQESKSNFTLENTHTQPVFNTTEPQVLDSFNGKMLIPADGKDDGSIGFNGAVKNMVKGVGNFFKGMVCDENGKFSLTRTLTTIGIGAAIGVTCAFLPAITIAGTTLSTLGLISAGFGLIAGYHVGNSAIDIMSANTDAEAETAWQGLGSGLTEGALAYIGYRASGGIRVKDSVAPTPSTPKEPMVEETVVENLETSSGEIKPCLNMPKEYIGPKEFNPADYVSADQIPGERFGKSNVNIKQYNEQGYGIRIIHAYDNVHVGKVVEYKPGSAAEITRMTSYRNDGITLEKLIEYSNGKKSKSTYYKEDGKTINYIYDHVSNTSLKYKYKNDGVTIDSVLEYDKDSIFPKNITQYENGKPVKKSPCDKWGKPIEEVVAEEPLATETEVPKTETVEETINSEPVAETEISKVEPPKTEQVEAEVPKAETQNVEPVTEPESAKVNAEPEVKAEAEAKAKAEAEVNLKDLSMDELQDLRNSCYEKIRNATSKEQESAFFRELTEIDTQIESLRQQKLYDGAEVTPVNSEFRSEIYEGSYISEHHMLNGHSHTIRNEFGNGKLSEATMSYINEVDREFAQLPPTKKDLKVFRSEGRGFLHSQRLHAQMMDDVKVGDIIVPDEAYSYSAFDKNVWGHYGYSEGNGFLYEIRVPKGAKISRNLEHACNGGEAVFPRGAQYKILNKNVAPNGDTYIVMEYILPNG